MTDGNIPLEVAKIVVGVLTPASIAGVGWILNSRLKTIEQRQWGKRKLIEKRLEIFERVSPSINKLYCYGLWVGDWKETTPPEALSLKRKLDKEFFIYRFLIGEGAFKAYQKFIHSMFSVFNAANSDARLRVPINGPDGDRRQLAGWNDDWLKHFHNDMSSKSDIHNTYVGLMVEFQNAIGLVDGE